MLLMQPLLCFIITVDLDCVMLQMFGGGIIHVIIEVLILGMVRELHMLVL